jgi:lipoprotein-anchoring transpeptidase ErfK/SrfK
MIRQAGAVLFSLVAVLFLASASPVRAPWIHAEPVHMVEHWQPVPAPGSAPIVQPLPERQPEPTPLEKTQAALDSGVLIVISKPTQTMFVFRDGQEWGTSPVSTGKKGHTTPSGVFPILQKRVHHRSNLYSNAPMPYMQRLTWDGIALHAGHLPGYPASHGCIRMPRDFARKLYAITDFDTTRVLVTDDPVSTDVEARIAAVGSSLGRRETLARAQVQGRIAEDRSPNDAAPALARAEVPKPARRSIPARSGRSETIQLVAAESSQEASDHWHWLVQRRPVLAQLDPEIIPAMVHSRRYYRLRATGAGAHAICGSLTRGGEDCFNVRN